MIFFDMLARGRGTDFPFLSCNHFNFIHSPVSAMIIIIVIVLREETTFFSCSIHRHLLLKKRLVVDVSNI